MYGLLVWLILLLLIVLCLWIGVAAWVVVAFNEKDATYLLRSLFLFVCMFPINSVYEKAKALAVEYRTRLGLQEKDYEEF